MKLSNIKKKPIILVSGKLCSGKGTYCKQFPDYYHIATSDVVKQISGLTKRSELHGTKSLDVQIASHLISLIEQHKPVIVDGIRQQSIIDAIIQHFGLEQIELQWLEVPDQELQRRYYQRSDNKDDQSFEIAMKRDYDLGLGDVESFIKSHPHSKIINYF